ncbi:MAG TPA: MoxR family ATPase [Methanospirillum sp.]|nr:MoxR family ATPase [Methanospirillum sp.]
MTHDDTISNSDDDLSSIGHLYTNISEKLAEFVVGNQDLTELILIALLAEGHILIEGLPGTAKTTIAKGIAIITGCEFARIQGAVDIQPADMIGVQIYNQNTGEFTLRKGPIFTNILLTDELNRVHPKAQSAFIESMSERQATIDGITLPLPRPFIVIATQNSFELEGTFPLIEAQRDRFMFSISVQHLNSDDELEIIRRASRGNLTWRTFATGIHPVTDPGRLLTSIDLVSRVRMEDPVHRYIRDLVIATREHPDIGLGVSSRASIAFVKGAKGAAALEGRLYVIPDDVKKIARSVLMHRISLTREAEIEGLRTSEIIEEILQTVEVP